MLNTQKFLVYIMSIVALLGLVSCGDKEPKKVPLTLIQKYEKQLVDLKNERIAMNKKIADEDLDLRIKQESQEEKRLKKLESDMYKTQKYMLNEKTKFLLATIERYQARLERQEKKDPKEFDDINKVHSDVSDFLKSLNKRYQPILKAQ